jgi:hypothetical protein
MNKNSNVIVINSKRYDAMTGDLLTKRSPLSDAPSDAPVSHARRKPAKHAKAHAPTHSRTLMRQAVKKPSVSLKRHLKAQGRIDSPVERPLIGSTAQPSLAHLDARLLAYAQRIKESRRISHFSSTVPGVAGHLSSSSGQAVKAPLTPTSQPPLYPRKPKTTAELLEYAMQQATSHEQKLPKQPRRHLFKRHASA